MMDRNGHQRTPAKGRFPIMDRLLYPYDEVLHKLAIGRTTLYELIRTGQLVRVRIGRHALITAESLTAYVDSLKDGTA
jgi:excisionase family DNA binding protein